LYPSAATAALSLIFPSPLGPSLPASRLIWSLLRPKKPFAAAPSSPCRPEPYSVSRASREAEAVTGGKRESGNILLGVSPSKKKNEGLNMFRFLSQ
jgi:hypothetical protein